MVIVGWDSAGGDDALELGRLLGASLGAAVLPVSVIVTGTSPRARADAERGDVRVVVAPSVALGLCDVANEVTAQAIVIGSSRRGPIGRALFGTSAGHLAAAAPCPVAIAPRGFARRYAARLRRTETTYDGSDESEQAIALAGVLAAADGGSVLIHADPGLRHAAEERIAQLPHNVTFEVDGTGSAASDGAVDVLVVGRSSEHARVPHAPALILI